MLIRTLGQDGQIDISHLANGMSYLKIDGEVVIKFAKE